MSKAPSKKIERPRIVVLVENGRLVAGSAWDQEQIDKLPRGRIIAEIDETEPEDGVRALFMAGIQVLFDNVDGTGPGGEWPTPNHLRREILREIGFAEPIMRVDGIKKEARSMARGQMTYDELVLVLEISRSYCVARWGFDPFQSWQDEKDAEVANRRARR
jgi:hypothetical protein